MGKRILCILLAACLCAPAVLSSCAGSPEETALSADPEPIADAAFETVPETEEETIGPDLPPDLDYNGRSVSIVHKSNCLLPEFNTEELTGDVVDDALFNSYLAVCSRLNITCELIPIVSSSSTQLEFVNGIQQSVMAGSGAYDIVSGYSMCLPTLSARGTLIDLLSTQYINLEQPWWCSRLLRQSTVNRKLFFATGDISNQLLYNMVVVYFNKDIWGEYSLESPYELVDDRKWTIDKITELSSVVYTDANGNGELDSGDRIGYFCDPVYSDAYWFNAGLSYVEIGEDGVPFLSPDIRSERAADLVEKMQSIYKDKTNGVTNQVGGFANGNVLFHTDELFYASSTLREVPFPFGIVPVPAYSEEDEFSTLASFTYTLYSVPIDAKDADMSSAVMEAMGYEGFRSVTPAVFETAIKLKYTNDQESIRMLDLIRDSMDFDFGRLFNASFNTVTYSMFRDAINNGGRWASVVKTKMPVLEKALEKLLKNFD